MNNHYKQAVQSKQGFTIIEVVLVLAIAGLIFLMVFLALPALQRGQRDTQRKDDLSRINTQIQNYESSNRGGIPKDGTDMNSFIEKYLSGTNSMHAGSEYADPSIGGDNNSGYAFTTVDVGTAILNPLQGTIYYKTASKCVEDGEIVIGNGRQYTLRIPLENQKALYCIDNS